MSNRDAMPRIVIIGPPTAILPFLAVGVELLSAEDVAAARGLLRKLAREVEKGVVFITDDLVEACREDIEPLRAKPTVAVLTLADFAGGGASIGAVAGQGHHEWIRERVRRAVGMDMLGERRR